jgi:hypothetical protein
MSMTARGSRIAIGAAILASMAALPAGAQDKISRVNNRPVVRHIFVPEVLTLNQPPNQVNGFFADSACSNCATGAQSIADNFIVNATPAFRVDQIVMWGGYFPGNVANTTDVFSIFIHSDAGGLPGAVVFSVTGIQASTRAMTGIVLFGVNEWMFTFNLAAPPTLAPGTYWVEIFNNTTANPGNDFFWETGNLDGTHGIADGAFATAAPGVTWMANPGSDSAVQINGTVVPVELQTFTVE